MTQIDFPAIVRDASEWRRHLHRHPELLYDLDRTSAFVSERLRDFGLDDVVTGIGRSGVVGVLHGSRRGDDRRIGLRADMDALPIREETGLPHASVVPGRMHACGHDGHTAMLLGAARLLSLSRRFAGTAVFIFQPAEEGGRGARAMLDDDMLARFPFDRIYALHSRPNLAIGRFATKAGPIMAASDRFTIRIAGEGGHAGLPHMARDPLAVAHHIYSAIQSIRLRDIDPMEAFVIAVTGMEAGEAFNVVPDRAALRGTFRSLSRNGRSTCADRLDKICRSATFLFGVEVDLELVEVNPVTVNDADAAAMASEVLRATFCADSSLQSEPMLASEDFSYFLEKRPGAFIWIGNGESKPLHHPAYDFDDRAIPYGVRALAALAEHG